MVRPVHYRVEGKSDTRSQPTACTEIGFNTLDTDLVTCVICRRTPVFESAHQRHSDVVEALASPKQEHPCLTNHRPFTSATPRNR